MTQKRKDAIHTLLKGIESGDPASVAVISPEQYIQHNPQTHEGRGGLAALFKRLSRTSSKINIVRLFSDGDYVFGQTEYDFNSRKVGFEVFRFEGDLTVEHWDNIQIRKEPNASGHSMVDGAREVTDLNATESNRNIISTFMSSILISDRPMMDEGFDRYFELDDYVEHSPYFNDDLFGLKLALKQKSELNYQKLHRVLAEGNFVLSVCEGYHSGVHTSFYDLFRLNNGKIIEHWSTTEAVPPENEWKNDNGKF